MTQAKGWAEIHLMESNPHFNFRDVLWAPAKALSAKQVSAMTLSLILALGIYNLFTYIAFLVDGQSLQVVWSAYGFFPVSGISLEHTSALVVLSLGMALALFSVMLGFLAVAATNIEAIRGNRFFSIRDAIRFVIARFRQLFLAEMAIVLFVAFIVLLFALFGLLTRLPYVGDWIFAILFLIPNFIIALFSVFIVFVFTLTFLLLPAVAAAERHGETFAAILETFSTIIRQPFRWAGYTLYSLLAAKVCSFIYAYFCFRAVQFMVWATSLTGGERLERLVIEGLGHLPVKAGLVRETFLFLPGLELGVTLPRVFPSGGSEAVGYVVSFMLFVAFASIWGYALAIVAAAQARGFVAIRYIKDGHNIAEEDSLFFTEEHVNPEIGKSPTGE